MYFDNYWLKQLPNDQLYAVDIGYGKDCAADNTEDSNIKKFYSIEELDGNTFDYAIMMDSLEYMDDDTAYLNKVSEYIKKDGYIFLTVPAFSKLFSDHDIHVRLLRRYDKKRVYEIVNDIDNLEMVHCQYFYFSLLIVRFVQVVCHMKIDPECKVTTGWAHDEKSLFTKFVTGILNLDYGFANLLKKIGINIPGLSILFVCKKK